MRPDTAIAQDPLRVERIRQHCVAYTVGRRIRLYESVGSTNSTLRDLARAGEPEGTVVLAECQTAGRGRAGKVWFSPPGTNLYASILFWPRIPAAGAAAFSFMASLALTDAIGEPGLKPAIKWPNDVLLKRRKVAGTLAELSAVDDRLEYVILGVGVNINVDRETLRAGLGEAAQSATSLREALGHPVDRNAFTAAFLCYLDEWLVRYRDQGDATLLRAWRDRDIVTGRRVEVRDGSRTLTGRARGVDAQGQLEVEDAQGRIHRVVTGDLRLLE
jgi:BirA family transcriptional regulator, biotin operon repressor / biotin---[acetyl-CoA-carboxylase] ligase